MCGRLRKVPWHHAELKLTRCIKLFFDARLDGEAEFACLGSIHTSLWAITHPRDEEDDERAGYPPVWRRPFRHMTRRWAACAWILEPRLSIVPDEGDENL